MLLPQQLRLLPARIAAAQSQGLNVSNLGRDALGALPAFVAAVLVVAVCGVPAFMAGLPVDAESLFLVAGAALYVLTSPFQDHLRSSLHLVGRHWLAAFTSVSMLLLTCAGLASALWLHIGAIAVFGSLAFGNLGSAAIAVLLLKDVRRIPLVALPPLLVRSRYVISDIVMQVSWYGASLFVVAILGNLALATLETARIASAPVFVLISGLSSVFVPVLIRATAGAHEILRQKTWISLAALLGTGAAYSGLALAMAPVISMLTGRPISAPLAVARSAAFSLEGAGNSLASPLYARSKSWQWIQATAVGAFMSLATLPLFLSMFGPYGLPLAQALGMILRLTIGSIALIRR